MLVDDAGPHAQSMRTKFVVRRPSRSEDIRHLLYEH